MKHRTTFFSAALFAVILTASGFQDSPQYKILFEKAKFTMETKGDLNGAITLFNEIIKKYPKEREYAAKSQLNIGLCYEKLGANQAQKAYQTVVDTWPDQTEMVALAKTKLTQLSGVTSESTLKAEQSFKVASDLYKEFKYESAITEYEKVIQLSPKSRLAEESRLWIGQCHYKEGKNDMALASFNTLIKEFPQSTFAPVTELMISQVKQDLAKFPNKKAIVNLGDNTILDPNTGIRFTKINSWAGKIDQLTDESIIANIAPNRKFMLADNKLFPLDNSDPVNLSDDSLDVWISSKLSPDATKIAYITKEGLSIKSASPATGRPIGAGILLVSEEIQKWPGEINWSPDGTKIIYSKKEKSPLASLWTVSINDGSNKQIVRPFPFGSSSNPVFSQNGANFIYKKGVSGTTTSGIRLASLSAGKSVILVDSCRNNGKFDLSPDNKWILYDKKRENDLCLFRLADKQKKELSIPEEVGSLISWSDRGSKAYFYKTSYDFNMSSKVVSIYGGPAFEFKNLSAADGIGWSPDSDVLLTSGKDKEDNKCILMISMTDQETWAIEGTTDPGLFPKVSPDGSKVIIGLKYQMSPVDLMILPISLKEGKAVGNPILLFKNFVGFFSDCAWSPDGKKIVVTSGGEVWICDAQGGTPIQLTKTPQKERFPVWSSDGKAIAVSFFGDSVLQIIRSSDGEIIKTIQNVNDYGWTPQADEIILAFTDGQLSTLSITSGQTRKITNWKEIAPNIQGMTCSPDGKWIAINGYKNGDDFHCDFFLINTANGNTREMAVEDPVNKEMMTWSPDSKWIAYLSYGSRKTRIAGTLWEADFSDFMDKMDPGSENGITTDFDFISPTILPGGVAPDGTFTDSRDGHVYNYKKIGEQTWMAENLAFLPAVSPASAYSATEKHYYVYDYNGSDPKEAMKSDNYLKYGVLYNWQAAIDGQSDSKSNATGTKGICPSGWHLPGDPEWIDLERTLGMNESDLTKINPAQRSSGFVDKKLRSITGWGEDDHIFLGVSGFNALPGGAMNTKWGFKAINFGSYFWTSTAQDEKMMVRYMVIDQQHNGRLLASKIVGFSIRCVKDK